MKRSKPAVCSKELLPTETVRIGASPQRSKSPLPAEVPLADVLRVITRRREKARREHARLMREGFEMSAYAESYLDAGLGRLAKRLRRMAAPAAPAGNDAGSATRP